MRGRSADLHPLRAADVLRAVGVTLPPGHTVEDELLRIACGDCGFDQPLSAARIEAAANPEDVTAYLCRECGALLLVTGHPSPIPVTVPGRHRFGDFTIQPVTPSGLRMAPPTSPPR